MHELKPTGPGKGDKDRTKKADAYKKNYEEIQWNGFIPGAVVKGNRTRKKY